MSAAEDLPCPQCGSTRTLGKVRAKRAAVKKRLEEERKRRYKPPPQSNGTINLVGTIGASYTYADAASQALTLGNAAGELVIGSPDFGEPGTILINEAILDVCIDCGTFYSPNAKRVGEEIETETFELDPLGALAEIRGPEDQ